MRDLWIRSENSFDPEEQQHQETIFTIGNGYLSTRRVFSCICCAGVWCASVDDLLAKGVAADQSNGFAGIPMLTIQ